MPPVVTELLRLCLVALFAGVGYQLGGYIEAHSELSAARLIGVVLGAAIGYVVGGAVSRLTVRSLGTAEGVLSQRSSDQVLAGLLGGSAAAVISVGVSWPLFLIRPHIVSIPIFAFVVIAVSYLGYRLGMVQQDGLLALLSGRAGLNRPRPNAARDRVIDTSVAIDGRVLDVVRSGFLHGRVLVIQPVLDELQGLADSGDDVKRARGRKGLDLLEALQRERGIDLEVVSDQFPEVPEVDAKLVRVCLARDAALLTLDTPLAKSAGLAGCRVMNLHALALAVRPPVTAGDSVTVLLMKAGKEHGQAVGYLDDGTMVVAEKARHLVGKEADVLVTSVLTTANGRMVFAKPTQPPPMPSPPVPSPPIPTSGS